MFISLVIVLMVLSVSQTMAQTTPPPLDKKVQSIEEKVQNIEREMNEVKVSKEYFGYTITVVTVIIIVLIALFIALPWWDFRRALKSALADLDKKTRETSDKLQAEFSSLKESISQSRKDYEGETKERFDSIVKDIDYRTTSLRAEIYRSYAQHWESRDSFGPAFIWWMRSAKENNKVGETSLTKISLDSAIKSLGKMETYSLTDPKYEIEMNDIIDAIKQRGEKWKLEISRIEELIREKKYPSNKQQEGR